MTQLQAHEVPLQKIFGSDYDFRIPGYQRPYSWGAEQASQLLEDLDEAIDRDSDEPYFLGSIVLVKAPSDTISDVIDGQQRLTTLTILIAVLRDLSADHDLADELTKMLMEPGSKVLGREPKPRLTLRERDQDFFLQYIQTRGAIDTLVSLPDQAMKTDSQRAMRDNALTIKKNLENWHEDKKLALVQLIGKQTFLVVVNTPDLDSAYRIFSVMNDRGLNLSEPDIFKSKVVGALPEEKSKAYADRWEDSEASLGREDFRDLFLHIRLIFSMERAKTNLLKEFPRQVLSQFLPHRPAEFVDHVLVRYAEAYEQMRDYTYAAASGADKVNGWFRRLDKIGDNDWRPVALWALVNHGDDPDWLDAFLRRLERLAASMMIRHLYTTPRAIRYAELLRELSNGDGLDAKRFELSPAEINATVAGLNGDVYTYAKGRRYILLRLDEALAQDLSVKYQHKLITVEHVLPQNPAPRSRWTKDFKDVERSLWTHRLANLVLLNRAKNSQASNLDFADKKNKYFAGKKGVSTFAVTSQVLHTEKWTPKTLESRQVLLIDTLRAEWNLK